MLKRGTQRSRSHCLLYLGLLTIDFISKRIPLIHSIHPLVEDQSPSIPVPFIID